MADPLKPEDLEKINSALAGLAEAKTFITRAKQAGVDIGDREEELKATETRLNGIKAAFFTGP